MEYFIFFGDCWLWLYDGDVTATTRQNARSLLKYIFVSFRFKQYQETMTTCESVQEKSNGIERFI